MANVTGIAITIKAFLPTGKTIGETYAALTVVETAHETGNYAPLLALAKIDEVKTEQKTRRVEDVTPMSPEAWGKLYQGIPTLADAHKDPGSITELLVQENPILDEAVAAECNAETARRHNIRLGANAEDADIPDFLKGKKAARGAA